MPAWLLPALMAGSSILSKAGGGASKERQSANDYQLQQNQLNQRAHESNTSALLNALRQNEEAAMSRAKLGIDAPQARAKQALLGSLMANARTARVTPPAGVRMGTVTGGLDLDALLANARGTGRTLNRQANRALRTGSDVPAYTDATARLSSAPTPGGYQKAGAMESLLGGGGLLASILAGVLTAKKAAGAEMDPVSKAGLGF